MCINRLTLTIMKINLRSHGVWSTTFLAKDSQLRAYWFGKSKVRNFDNVVFKQYVFELQVSMNDVFFIQVIDPFNDLLKVDNFFLNGSFLQIFPQIAITKF